MKFDKAVQTLIDKHKIKIKFEKIKNDCGGYFNIEKDAIIMNLNKSSYSTKYTILHELVHWTGVKKRLNRDKFGTACEDSYKLEENIANFGTWFLAKELDILDGDIFNKAINYKNQFIIDDNKLQTALDGAHEAVGYLTKRNKK